MAAASPSAIPSVPSDRQWTPDASRQSEMFDASLFSSFPTVSGVPVYGTSAVPSADATTSEGMTNVSSKNAFSIVAPAPANAAWAAGYDGCAGDPSGYAIASRYVPYFICIVVSTGEFRISGWM